tara:strand:- start:291593 stop:291841 length:249 start_codon:yes stop_codon:yes gene_type:complete
MIPLVYIVIGIVTWPLGIQALLDIYMVRIFWTLTFIELVACVALAVINKDLRPYLAVFSVGAMYISLFVGFLTVMEVSNNWK